MGTVMIKHLVVEEIEISESPSWRVERMKIRSLVVLIRATKGCWNTLSEMLSFNWQFRVDDLSVFFFCASVRCEHIQANNSTKHVLRDRGRGGLKNLRDT